MVMSLAGLPLRRPAPIDADGAVDGVSPGDDSDDVPI